MKGLEDFDYAIVDEEDNEVIAMFSEKGDAEKCLVELADATPDRPLKLTEDYHRDSMTTVYTEIGV